MIKHHPSQSLLTKFSAGELPLSLSIALSAHLEMCPVCQAKLKHIETSQADDTWHDITAEAMDFGDMMHRILAMPAETVTLKPKPCVSVNVAGQQFKLPYAFGAVKDLNWSGFGAINRARVITDEDNVRASLLHINAGGEIPTHQHKGYELTLLLAGSFSDEFGTYTQGDFIWLDGDVKHSPNTKNGCLCYAVQDAPLRFTHGVSQVLNPLGKLIY